MIVGYGRVGAHVVTVLERFALPYLVVETDARRAAEFTACGIPLLQGDAANSDVLTHAGLDHARALMVTLPDELATQMVVHTAQQLAPALPIIARASTQAGVTRLRDQGVRHVIHPELEGGLVVLRHTLLTLAPRQAKSSTTPTLYGTTSMTRPYPALLSAVPSTSSATRSGRLTSSGAGLPSGVVALAKPARRRMSTPALVRR